MQKNILIIEDELNILRILSSYFEKDGYTVFQATDGKEGLSLFLNTKIDLIILDVMLPKIDGFELAKRIRSNSNVPIIIMTALGDETNMLKGYQLNCDDYIVKPFPPKVLVSKANVLLKRINNSADLTNIYKVGPLELNFLTNELKIDGVNKEISKTEFELLAFLIKNKNKACSRTLLLDEIWGLDVYVDGRIVDTYIKNLRKILKPYTYIKTVFGVGYQFEESHEKD